MIKFARVLRCGLLFFVFCFSVFGASLPTPATAGSDTVVAQHRSQPLAHHHRDGVKPKEPQASEPSSLFQIFWQKPKDTVRQAVGWAVNFALPAATAYAKNTMKGFLESIKAYSFLGLIGLFALLVVSAFIGTSFANGSFVRKLYKIIERSNPSNKPVVLLVDEQQMKVINPKSAPPLLENTPNNVVQLEMKTPVVIDNEPSPKGGRKSRPVKKAA